MAEHTPGEWHLDACPDGAFQVCDGPDFDSAAVICSRNSWPRRAEESNANARLIAAAPDLLAACEQVLHFLDYLQDLWGKEAITDMAARTLRSAVEKAKGAA
jgi:hypothetical protein